MRTISLLSLFVVLLTGLSSCKKDSQPQSVDGKWYEVKLNMYALGSNPAQFYKTTYLQPFTTLDYVQINSDGTLTISSDHYYYANIPGQQAIAPQAISQQTANWTYTSIGSKYLLNNKQNSLPNYAGIVTADTLSMHADTLVWHNVLYGPAGNATEIDDSFFVK